MYELIKKNKNLFLMALILIFALILRFVFFSGIDTSDSLFYTRYADSLSKNNFEFTESQLSFRLGLIFPVSVLYSIFGVNEFSSNIVTLLISLGSIILIYHLGKLIFNEKVGLLSAFLLSFFPMNIFYSTKLMTDLPSAFFVALSVFLFLKSEKLNKRITSNVYYLFSGLSLGLAYLMKELSLIIGLFFIIYVIYNKKIKIGYSLIALGFILIFFIEIFYLYSLTGDPFSRYTTISDKTIVSVIDTNNYGRGDFPLSLFHYPYVIFTDKSLGLFYPFIFIAIFFCIKRKETYNLLFWFIPLILYISFGSMSLTSYVPIPAAARFLSIITYPGILLLAYFLAQEEKLIKKVLMPSIIILLLATSIGYLYISERGSLLKNERVAYEYVKTFPGVYTDERTVKIFEYLSGYEGNNNIQKFNSYDTFHPENVYSVDLSPVKDSYVVIHHSLINFLISSKKGIKFPDEIFNIPGEWVLKKSIGKGENRIDIYYIP